MTTYSLRRQRIRQIRPRAVGVVEHVGVHAGVAQGDLWIERDGPGEKDSRGREDGIGLSPDVTGTQDGDDSHADRRPATPNRFIRLTLPALVMPTKLR